MECYFDNSATTKPCQEAVDAAVDALTNRWGNPSSLHKPGDGANRLLTECRKTVAATLRAQPEEIVFTGCGTDSNNLAIFGSAWRFAAGANELSQRTLSTRASRSP